MRKTIAILALAAAVATTPLIGQGMQLPGQKDASRVTAGTYKTDPGHSLIGWEVNHFGFNDYFGIFGDVAGTLTIDPANPNAAKVDVTIPVAKVTTACRHPHQPSAARWQGWRQARLLRPHAR